jgi:Tol biopolymer transport system component
MALALCLLALVAIQPAEAAFPGMNGKIAFVSNRDVGAGEIYTISPTGGTATRIAFTNFSKDPAWSSDGSRIAFASTDNEIFVMKADGSGRRQITNTPTAKQEPAWSPDGTQIAYVANSFDVDQQTDFEIWVINADGSGRRQITNNSIPDAQPAWSPDGSKIAFVSSRTGDSNRNIYVMNSDGSGTAANLTPNTTDPVYQGHDDGPSWSPDGSKIVYTNATSDADVWTMNAADGSGKTNLTNANPSIDNEPAWSPDGNKIAYMAATPDANIYVMNANGGGQGPIDTNTANDIKPDWQPIPQCTNTNATTGNDTITGTAGNDILCGLGGNDTINGAGGNDIILAGAGNDRLTGALGNDTLNGGPGTDTVLYPGSTAVRANLTTEFATGVGMDVLLGVENLTGSGANDQLTGSSVANVLVGGNGADALSGLGGADTLNSRDGVNGNDTLSGGAGTDQCVTDARERSITSCP